MGWITKKILQLHLTMKQHRNNIAQNYFKKQVIEEGKKNYRFYRRQNRAQPRKATFQGAYLIVIPSFLSKGVTSYPNLLS